MHGKVYGQQTQGRQLQSLSKDTKVKSKVKIFWQDHHWGSWFSPLNCFTDPRRYQKLPQQPVKQVTCILNFSIHYEFNTPPFLSASSASVIARHLGTWSELQAMVIKHLLLSVSVRYGADSGRTGFICRCT